MRESVYSIFEKRKRKSVIFLTGATGFLGSNIAVELLKKGYSVIFLSRSNDNLNAYQRIQQILGWFDYQGTERIKVVEGELGKPQFGLDRGTYAYLLDNIDEIFHCAAETSFTEDKREQLEKANVQGTLNALKLAAESKCYFFHHISTAYVAGKRHGICKEEYVPQNEFYNAYEETKHKAERLVLEACGREGIRANIYRPSIIFGDSRSGKSLKFDAFYFAARAVNSLKTFYDKDIDENNGLNAEKLGISKGDDGKIYLPIRIEKIDGTTLNAVPVDFVVDGCMAIMENCLDGDIFHLVNRNPKIMDELLIFLGRLLNVRGIRAVPYDDFNNQPQNALEKLLDPYMDIYRSYIRDDRIFEDKKAARILQKNNIVCPDPNYEITSRCFKYAIEVDWGNRLFYGVDPPANTPPEWLIIH